MAINFPDSPGIGSVFTDSTSGFSYEWNGTLWKSFTASSVSNIQILDDISGSFNNSTTTFNLTVGSVAAVPANAQQLEVILGGIQQSPGVDYTISSSTVTFTTAPASGLTFSGKLLGTALSLNTISADTDGSGLTNIPAGQLTGTLPAIDGSNLTSLDASELDSGTVPVARLSGLSTNLVSAVGIQSGGTAIGVGITQLNFVGTGNTFKVTGTTVDISIEGGGGGGAGLSTTGISTGLIFSNPNTVSTAQTLTNPDHNYAMFGPVTLSATVEVGVGNTFTIV